MSNSTVNKEMSFQQKVFTAGGILAFIVVMILLLKAVFNVLLLILAGCLLAVYFRGLSGLIQKKTGWKEGICLTVSILGTLLLLIGLFWLMGAKIAGQMAQLSDTLPKTLEQAKSTLSSHPLGKDVVGRLSSPESAQKIQSVASSFFKSTFGILGDIYVILFLGIFFTVSPSTYKKVIVQLVPPKGQRKASDVLDKTGETLKKWLKGQLFSMLVVFILT
ncbi:MAG TPA: AI-2E family transporter, partial [Flavisolibacter sp.]|nr:AI-2E family transporter [Flavisolibacter sp.]